MSVSLLASLSVLLMDYLLVDQLDHLMVNLWDCWLDCLMENLLDSQKVPLSD